MSFPVFMLCTFVGTILVMLLVRRWSKRRRESRRLILAILRDAGCPLTSTEILLKSSGFLNGGSIYVLLAQLHTEGLVRTETLGYQGRLWYSLTKKATP
jgi:DNA-binding PadR family transcriptional regulator